MELPAMTPRTPSCPLPGPIWVPPSWEGGRRVPAQPPPNQAGVQTNTLLIPRPENGIWDFTGNVGPSHSSFKTKALRERPAPPRHPGRLRRHCLPATPSRQPAPPLRHWDQLRGTGSSNRARTTGLVCTAGAQLAAGPTLAAAASAVPKSCRAWDRQRHPSGDTGPTPLPPSPPPG